jgi:hypothetical protein
MLRHIIGFSIAFISIIILPYWVYVPVLFVAIVLIPFFWEGIVLGFLIDVLYGSGVEAFPSFVSPFALAALIGVIIMLPVRNYLRYYV